MSRAGIAQLRRLTLRYCEHGGSSRGARAFINSRLPALQSEFPNIEFEVKAVNAKHPTIFADFDGPPSARNPWQVSVRNHSLDEVEQRVRLLRAQNGDQQKRLSRRIARVRRSVQGVWSPLLPKPVLAASAPPRRPLKPFRSRAGIDAPLRFETGVFVLPEEDEDTVTPTNELKVNVDHPVW
eukprot:CAMPEP_0177653020 /NCGR_PEP_ID=MMETSP0447-20121125/13485_1 /TAXON_ID=0 /ORGANISM="Stygamoeba regulata, Strain BSH-02190019" /LENGTH=181 /DNA_ID=CAMNT_0019156393 /DNA_START=165 /DNA_END=707 /DNA_ORIENTATION=+